MGILAFAAIEGYLFSSGAAEQIMAAMPNNWLLVLGAFILVSLGRNLCRTSGSVKRWPSTTGLRRIDCRRGHHLCATAYDGDDEDRMIRLSSRVPEA